MVLEVTGLIGVRAICAAKLSFSLSYPNAVAPRAGAWIETGLSCG